jgi:hypothetical protein
MIWNGRPAAELGAVGSGLAAEFGNAVIGLGYSHKYDFSN